MHKKSYSTGDGKMRGWIILAQMAEMNPPMMIVAIGREM
jgi:hypothetical protein